MSASDFLPWIDPLRDIGVFSIAAIILQKILDNSSNRKLEKYKQQLDHSTRNYQSSIDANLEKYKQELDFTARNYQSSLDASLERYKSEITFHLNKQNSLHEKRLTVIDEMYKFIVTLDSAMRDMMAPMQAVKEDAEKEEQERVSLAHKAFADYNNYFLYNKLYFSKDLSQLLEKIQKDYFSARWDFFEPNTLKAFTNNKPSHEGYMAAVKTAQEASKKVRQEIPKTIETLEDEFRKILGVD